ncbi:MAG: cysteine peptidase family C39 domain-containing protein [Opitutaceae bacterium]
MKAMLAKKFGHYLNEISELTGVRAVIDPLPHPKRAQCETSAIPGYKQVQDYSCGFIAAANVLHLFNPEAELEHLYAALDDRDGTNESDVIEALRAYGLGVRRRTTLDYTSMCEAVRDGSPVICAVQAHFSLHWVVIYGYDSKSETVFICGNGLLPRLNKKELTYEDFCEKWKPKGNGLVCSAGSLKQPRLRKKTPTVRVMKK